MQEKGLLCKQPLSCLRWVLRQQVQVQTDRDRFEQRFGQKAKLSCLLNLNFESAIMILGAPAALYIYTSVYICILNCC